MDAKAVLADSDEANGGFLRTVVSFTSVGDFILNVGLNGVGGMSWSLVFLL